MCVLLLVYDEDVGVGRRHRLLVYRHVVGAVTSIYAVRVLLHLVLACCRQALYRSLGKFLLSSKQEFEEWENMGWAG
jgi:hypothetical protein